jgi:7-cyano-7-deazaguanine synthase in queuosine biosynthesis
MYKELAAHLNQVDSVITNLHGQDAKEFDYNYSQTSAISISYGQESEKVDDLVKKILNHYGAWHYQEVNVEVKTSMLLQIQA